MKVLLIRDWKNSSIFLFRSAIFPKAIAEKKSWHKIVGHNFKRTLALDLSLDQQKWKAKILLHLVHTINRCLTLYSLREWVSKENTFSSSIMVMRLFGKQGNAKRCFAASVRIKEFWRHWISWFFTKKNKIMYWG